MAEKKSEGGEGGAAPPKRQTKLLLFIVIGVLVIVLGGAGAAYFLLSKKSHTDEEDLGEEPAATEKAKKPKKKVDMDAPPVFVKLEPFTIKLQTEQLEAYLQATPELRVLDAPVGDRVKQYMPEIRHKVLLLMSGKKASDLSTPQGVQMLSNEVRVAVNVILDGPKIKAKVKGKPVREEAPAVPTEQADPDDSVQAVLFTSFIIQ